MNVFEFSHPIALPWSLTQPGWRDIPIGPLKLKMGWKAHWHRNLRLDCLCHISGDDSAIIERLLGDACWRVDGELQEIFELSFARFPSSSEKAIEKSPKNDQIQCCLPRRQWLHVLSDTCSTWSTLHLLDEMSNAVNAAPAVGQLLIFVTASCITALELILALPCLSPASGEPSASFMPRQSAIDLILVNLHRHSRCELILFHSLAG